MLSQERAPVMDFPKCTLWIKRIEHRKWNRGHNGLHQLGQPVAPSILFPVFNPPYPQGSHFELNRMAFHRFLLFLKDGNTVSVVDSVLVKESTRQYEDCRDSLPAGVCYTLLTNNPVRRYKRTNHRPPSFNTCKTGWSLSYLRRARCKTSVEGPSWSSSRRTAEPPATSAAATPTSPTHSARPSYVYQRLISKSYVIV